MHRAIAVAAGLVFCASLVPALAQPAGAPTNLQGTWVAATANRDGQADADVVGHRLSFSGDRFAIQSSKGERLYAGTVRVDASAKPAAIDFEHAEGAASGKVWRGIYSLEGDTLRICDNAANPNQGRPVAFEAKAGSGYVLVTFTRAKP